MNKMKYATLAFLPTVSVFAEGANSGSSATDAAGLLTDAQTALTGMLTSAFPVIATVVVAGLGIWGAIKLVRIVKRALSAGS